MVRVFKCHSFKSATVVPVSDEPLAVCGDGDLVFVATRQCTIKIFKRSDDDSGFVEWRCISTICTVEKIAYNKFKDYIITLEQKRSWKSLSRYIRVYLNWHLESQQGKSTKQRTKVRIAGKAHSLHSSKEYMPQLEVVDLPLDGTVTALDVCRATGNFAVAFGREVKLYQIVEKTVANSDRTYQDVEPFLELCWNFEVISASLSEEYLVCCSHKQVQGISITYAEGDDGSPRLGSRVRSPMALEQSSRSSSRGETTSPRLRATSAQRMMFSLDDVPGESDDHRSPSPAVSVTHSTGTQQSVVLGLGAPRAIVDDEHYQEWSFEPDDNIPEDSDDLSKSHSKIIYLHSLHRGSPHPQHGVAPPVLRDFRGGPVKSSSGVSAKTVLHLSDLKEQDDWLSVSLIPVHLPEQDWLPQTPHGWSASSPVRSSLLPRRCSVCCYVSSHRGGYLYRLHPGVSLVSTYRYTDLAYKVAVGPHLLQVVTKTGLESYTARWGAVALSVTEGGVGEEEVRPPSSLDICLCGIEPFFGATDLSHGTDIIALLTKIAPQTGQEDLQWNLYVLQNSTVAEFYQDMVTFAARIQETGPASYLHIVQEAHLLLRWELRRCVTSDQDLQDLYHESCALLGDYYSWPRQDDWHLCLPYYKKSGLKVSDVVRQAVQHRQHTKEQTSVYVYGRGLMQYLDWVLFHSDSPLDLKEDMSNTVLHIYASTGPESLPSVILLSRLEGYSPETARHLLSDLSSLKESRGEQSSTLERLAFVKVHLLLCDPNAAEIQLSSLDKGELLEICTQHPDLIHTAATEFTPLGQLMRRHAPDTLLHLLANIVGQGHMTLDTCLHLLEKHCEAARCQNNQVREFLEVLLNDESRQMWFEEAAGQLCEIYVQRLLRGIRAQPPKQKRAAPTKFHVPSGNGHFASRFPWLDYLPPVTSPSCLNSPCQRVAMAPPGVFGLRAASIPLPVKAAVGGGKEGLQEEVCTCGFCVQDLLKLQSLLCSKHTREDLRSLVLRLMEGRRDMIGWDSVWMLCSHVRRTKDITEFAVDKYPNVVAKLAATTFGHDLEKWQVMLRCLEARQKEQMPDTSSGETGTTPETSQHTLLSAYKDVLGELVELFPAEEFLSSLPADGSLWFLLPFITRCLQRKHLDELKSNITGKGRSLLMQLNTSS
ncbi:BLOC-2 complex member HPS3-like [Littorina saxatilis]|uniref:Hermansky-Pudlak syndrome 3 protein n=1 Tax=Littorina saxatilis TaxID=31220 RepID=A0AAN9AUK8_9CAEN